jgi:hypothetical protein
MRQQGHFRRQGSRDVSADEAIAWLDRSGLALSALDSDGKFFVIQKYFEAARWRDALGAVATLVDADFEATPVLLLLAGNAHLIQAVPDELKAFVLEQLPNETYSFPLADDAKALEHRRLARRLYERAVTNTVALGCALVANLTSDRVLWLQLRDPEEATEARLRLAQSMREASSSKFVPTIQQIVTADFILPPP